MGVGRVVLSGATGGAAALVAAGSVVTKDVPARTMVVGIPAQAKRELADEAVAEQRAHARRYAELAGRHAALQG